MDREDLFGIVVGFHLTQGLVLPQADAMKNAAVVRTIEAVPGIGAGAGAMSNLLMRSAVLIKNTAGAAAVAVLIFLASVPMVRLAVLMALYYLAAAVMQLYVISGWLHAWRRLPWGMGCYSKSSGIRWRCLR